MANIKSAKKRILVNETKAARNKAIKSKVKTCVKKVETAVANKDVEAAKAALKVATVEINKVTKNSDTMQYSAGSVVLTIDTADYSEKAIDDYSANIVLAVKIE